MRAVGTLELPLTSYATEDWRRKEDSVLVPWSADSVGAKKKGMWGKFSVASTIGRVAGRGALLFYYPLFHTCQRHVRDSAGNRENHPKSSTTYSDKLSLYSSLLQFHSSSDSRVPLPWHSTSTSVNETTTILLPLNWTQHSRLFFNPILVLLWNSWMLTRHRTRTPLIKIGLNTNDQNQLTSASPFRSQITPLHHGSETCLNPT